MSSSRPRLSQTLLLGAISSFLLVTGCGDGSGTPWPPPSNDEPPAATDGDFESAHPGGPGAARDIGTDEVDGASGQNAGAATPPSGDDTTSDDVSRDIEEADIIKLEGTRLYALSQFGGLSVIDIADPSEMSLIGRFKVTATPFEMYVREGVVMVLYNGYGEYAFDEADDTWTFYQTSYVIAVDTSGEAPEEIGRFHIPGYISDSRIVGDALYVVAFESGYCWGCGDEPRTNLLSLDVADPTDIEQVDELSFEEREQTYTWRRSVAATNERMYIAGPSWGEDGPVGSEIQVVDISDPGGDMVLGDSVVVQGQVNNRWQMDEFEGVLRVISQPMSWRTNDMPPRIETFSIESSESLTELGSAAMQIPDNESLRSVRFDGERAYAITAEQMDPLFTIDLSDAEMPQQVGELEMPGWVYHMEPRGDRLLGLGFDQGNEDGGITVSLFDVDDLSAPTMIERVNFGGDWSSLPEDQDRIHKAFAVLEEHELLLVPFSGWSYDEQLDEQGLDEFCGSGRYVSGVQLIDWKEDTLQLRGVAPVYGSARRGFIEDNRLLTMSDDRVESFDIDDRDRPESLDRVSLALQADQVAAQGDLVARIGQNWYASNQTELTISSLADANNPDAGRIIELPDVQAESCYSSSWIRDMMAADDRVYVVYEEYRWDRQTEKDEQSTRIITVDASDPDRAEVLGVGTLGFRPGGGYGYTYGMVETGREVLHRGSTLIFSQATSDWDDDAETFEFASSIEVVDMSDPDAPEVQSVVLPNSNGNTGLQLVGELAVSSYFVQSPTNPDVVRFYLNRVDLSGDEPELLDAVSIPGSLLSYDDDTERALTLEYSFDRETATPRECYEELGGVFEAKNAASDYDYERTEGDCVFLMHTLRLVAIEDGKATIEDSHAFERGTLVARTARGDDRLFIAPAASYYGAVTGGVGVAVDVAEPGGGALFWGYYGYNTFESSTAPLYVVSGLRSGELSVGSIELETGQDYYGSFQRLEASGERAVVATGFAGKLAVVDAAEVDSLRVVRDVDVWGSVSDLVVSDGVAIAAMGYDGIQTIRIND